MSSEPAFPLASFNSQAKHAIVDLSPESAATRRSHRSAFLGQITVADRALRQIMGCKAQDEPEGGRSRICRPVCWSLRDLRQKSALQMGIR